MTNALISESSRLFGLSYHIRKNKEPKITANRKIIFETSLSIPDVSGKLLGANVV